MPVTLEELATSVHQFFQDKLPGLAGDAPGSMLLVFDPFGLPLSPGEFGVGGTDSQQQLLAHQRAGQLADQLPAANGLSNGWYLAQTGSRLSRWYRTLLGESVLLPASDQETTAFAARKAAAQQEFDLNAMIVVAGSTPGGGTVDPTGVHDTFYATGMTPSGWYKPDADCWETHHIGSAQPAAPADGSPVPTPGFHLRVAAPVASATSPGDSPPSVAFTMPLNQDDGGPYQVTDWKKQVGQLVTAGEPLVDVETAKVSQELQSPATGTLLEIAAKVGDAVPVGGLLALIGDGAPPPSPTTNGFDVTFDYCLVSFDRPWWDEIFVTTPNWFVQSFKSGQVASGRASAPALGIPAITAGMIVIRDLKISAAWTDSDQQRLASGAISLGPFSVADASLSGQTLTRPGMQTTAWICQVPPMLPPADPQSLLVN